MRYLVTIFLLCGLAMNGQERLAVMKYKGGGDWYANPTALKNLSIFCNQRLGMDLDPEYATVEPGDQELFNFPFVHMTGHGNVVFSEEEAENLRSWLIAGGFLHIDDNYGMDEFIRPQMKRIFPELDWVPLPSDHPIFHQSFDFPQGLPKIHEHDKKPPVGLALIWEGRVIVYYTVETDLGDGWEDPEVHNDPVEKRLEALKMGANLIQYALTIN
ncbi:MAG: DUF4159 domain-containing protein [Bacteroidota bacterium]|nr:DUF4159 domain-containing protein [Bacteroidota bacterium]